MTEQSETAESASQIKAKPRRTIGGNLPYTNSVGVLTSILTKLIGAEKPEKFSADFVDKVLGHRGGSARAAIPILKKAGLLHSDGSPTENYGLFKSDSNRSTAAFTALKEGFAEIFRISEYAHRASETELKDIIEQITGLPKGDQIIGYIFGTFNAFNSFVAENVVTEPADQKAPEETIEKSVVETGNSAGLSSVGLSYQINIMMPETTDIKVYDAIFKSLKANLL